MDRDVFTKKVFPLFSLSIVLMAVGAFIGLFIPPIFNLPLIIAFFVVLIMTHALKKQKGLNLIMLCIFSTMGGLFLSPLIYMSLGMDSSGQIIVHALGLTSIAFFSLAGYVWFTNADFRHLGNILGPMLIILILVSILSWFMSSGSVMFLVITVVSLMIFMGYVLYDMSKILRDYPNDEYIAATIALYLDFLNMFRDILWLLMFSRDRD